MPKTGPAERYHPFLRFAAKFLPLVVGMTAQVVYPIFTPRPINRVCKFAVDYISGAVEELAVEKRQYHLAWLIL